MVADVRDAWRAGWRKPSRDGVHEWASDGNVVLDGDFARKGRFSLESSLYLLFAFALLSDDRVRMLSIAKAVQTAGSLVAEVFLQWVFKNRPGPFMATWQSDDDGEKHYLTRIEPTFKAGCNAEMFGRLKKKRDLYRWPHMSAYFQGANINSLQGKSIRYEWNDEVWCWRPGMLGEAWARTEAFRRVCKILNISQGGDVGTDWDDAWSDGKRFVHAISCEKCHRPQELAFFARMADDENVRAGIVWDRNARYPDGRWNPSRAAETARFKCRFCGHEHTDDQRTWDLFDRSSQYLCLDPERSMKNCSLRWNALAGGDWGRLVDDWIKACTVRDGGSTEPMRKFYQKKLALFWDPTMAVQKVELQTSGYLMEAPFAEGYQAAPLDWESMRIITADYQQGVGNDTRHLLVVARAWGDRHSKLLWEGRVNTFEELYRLQTALGVAPACVCIDGSFEMMEVATQCVKYGWTMLIGDDAEFFLHKRKHGHAIRRPYSERFRVDPQKGKAGQGRKFCWAFRWSNPSIKNLTWNLRHGASNHTWEVASNVSPRYRQEIDGEAKKKVVVKKTGGAKWQWVTLGPNHAWDCECMQSVVAVAAGLLTFDLEDEKAEEENATAAKPHQAPVAPHDQPEQLELLPA